MFNSLKKNFEVGSLSIANRFFILNSSSIAFEYPPPPKVASIRFKSLLIGIKDSHEGITPKMIVDAGGKIPFGHSADMDFWCSLVKQNFTRHESFIYKRDEKFDLSDESIKGFLLPMVLKKKKTLEPIDSSMNIKSGNQITFLINKKNEDKAQQWLKDNKFEKTVKTK